MNRYIFILMVFISSTFYGQITFAYKEKKDSLYRSQAYLFLNRAKMYRELQPNYNFIPGELEERAYETSLNTYSFGIGLKGYLLKSFVWDGGIEYLQNGEQYSFNPISGDTSFSYQTYYKYISMPLKVNFIFGKSIRIFGGVGILPQLFLNYRQNQQWKTTFGNKESNTIKSKDGFNSFVASATFNLGISFHSNNGYGIFINPEYRYQLANGYGKNSYYTHKSFGLGWNFGVIKEL